MKTTTPPLFPLLVLSIIVALLLFAMPRYVFAIPQPVMVLSGSVTILGFPAHDGTEVRAEIGGVVYRSPVTANVTIGGTYGINAPFQVPADDPVTLEKEGGVNGEIVVLLVGGEEAGSTLFRSGGAERIDLLVTEIPFPRAPTNLVKTSPDNDTTPSFTWTGLPEAATFEIRIDDGGPISTEGSTVFTVPIAGPLSEGFHTLFLRGVNPQGVKGGITTLSFLVDISKPGIPSNVTRTGPDNPPSFTWISAVDLFSDIDHYDLAFDQEPLQNIGNVTSYTSPTFLSLGAHLLRIRAVDAAGNVGDEVQVFFDVTIPPPRDTGSPSITPTPSSELTPTPEPTLTPTVTPEPTTTPEISTTPLPEETPIGELTPTPETGPEATPEATPAVVPTPGLEIKPKFQEIVILPSFQEIGPDAGGIDDKGNIITTTGGAIQISQLQGGVSIISVPVLLPAGSSLESFLDPETSISVQMIQGKTIISLPVKDDQGRIELIITITVDQLVGTDTAAEAIVRRLDVEIPEKSIDLSSADPEVGIVSASLSSQLSSIPDSASISIAIFKDPTPEDSEAFTSIAEEEGSSIKDIAFTVSIEKDNLRDKVDLFQSFITMNVSSAWVDKVEVDNVRILRLADDGGREMLHTSFLGFDEEGTASFRGFSPRGLSVFGLVALDTPPIGTVQAVIEPFGSARIQSDDGDIIVLLPENPLQKSIRLRLVSASVATAPAPALDGFGMLDKLFILEVLDEDLRPLEDLVFEFPVQVVLFYTDEELQAVGAEESNLILAQFKTTEGEWRLLHTTVDPHQKRVIASVDSLSYFVLMARGATTPSVSLPGVGEDRPEDWMLWTALGIGLAGLASGVYLLHKTRSPKRA